MDATIFNSGYVTIGLTLLCDSFICSSIGGPGNVLCAGSTSTQANMLVNHPCCVVWRARLFVGSLVANRVVYILVSCMESHGLNSE